jgi:hypothetical protein
MAVPGSFRGAFRIEVQKKPPGDRRVSKFDQFFVGLLSKTRLVHPSYEVPNKSPAITEKAAAAVLPETHYHESTWMTVLLPARVHSGPSDDTPIIRFYAGWNTAPRQALLERLDLSHRTRRFEIGVV